MPKTAIVLPCYNEASRLDREAILAFSGEHVDIRLLLMDDGSDDDTKKMIDELAAASPGVIEAYGLPKNVGKAAAVRAGVRHLLRDDEHLYVGYWDADLATPLAEIPRFVDVLDAAPSLKLVMGTRLKRLGANVQRSAIRHYLGRIFATAASLTLRLPVYDTQCGAKLMRRDLAGKVFAESFTTRWLFDVEILARVIEAHGYEATLAGIQELPLLQWIDQGESRVRPGDFLHAPLELARIGWRYRKHLRGSTLAQLG